MSSPLPRREDRAYRPHGKIGALSCKALFPENFGISVNNTFTMSNIDKRIFASVTGDQVAITDIRINRSEV